MRGVPEGRSRIRWACQRKRAGFLAVPQLARAPEGGGSARALQRARSGFRTDSQSQMCAGSAERLAHRGNSARAFAGSCRVDVFAVEGPGCTARACKHLGIVRHRVKRAIGFHHEREQVLTRAREREAHLPRPKALGSTVTSGRTGLAGWSGAPRDGRAVRDIAGDRYDGKQGQEHATNPRPTQG